MNRAAFELFMFAYCQLCSVLKLHQQNTILHLHFHCELSALGVESMASLADSKAHFLARCMEYSVPEELIDNMRVAGVSTMAHLAFGFVRPGQDFEEKKV